MKDIVHEIAFLAIVFTAVMFGIFFFCVTIAAAVATAELVYRSISAI